MHKSIPIVFALGALFILSLCSACMSQSTPNQTSEQNGGLKQIIVPTNSPYISFDAAQHNLEDYNTDISNESTGIPMIYAIYGLDVDDTGNATSWIFGVRHSGGTLMLAYDLSGWKKIPWNASLGLEEINTGSIVTPDILFSRNSALILNNPSPMNPERRDLELVQGIYTLTITSGSNDRILSFNATTGELIP
jgi:hypothetical protein